MTAKFSIDQYVQDRDYKRGTIIEVIEGFFGYSYRVTFQTGDVFFTRTIPERNLRVTMPQKEVPIYDWRDELMKIVKERNALLDQVEMFKKEMHQPLAFLMDGESFYLTFNARGGTHAFAKRIKELQGKTVRLVETGN